MTTGKTIDLTRWTLVSKVMSLLFNMLSRLVIAFLPRNTQDWSPLGWTGWISLRSNQFILKVISPKYSLEGLMLKLKSQYFGHLMQRTDSLEKTLILGKIESRRRRGDDRGWDGWMASPTRWTWVWVNSGSWWWTGRPVVLEFMGSQRVEHDWATDLIWSGVGNWEFRFLMC